ncbi:MAG: RNA polymerase factor sigma-54 [Desulfobulbaceae bacterium]|nr:RNA polymerase factor sigma-54 [Desulfobulbaceae bacterium]
MVLELRQQVKLAQKLVMTPQLRQAIKLLQLNRLELTTALQAEIEQNPALEEVPDFGPELSDFGEKNNLEVADLPESAVTTRINTDDPAVLAEVNWSDYTNNFDNDISFSRETPPADAPSQFDFISATPGLDAHLYWQLSHVELSEKELEIAEFIIGNLDHHGFLTISIPEICHDCDCDEELATSILDVIQSFDPPGVAARNIRESLLLQLERENLADHLAYRIVRDHITLLESRNFAKIAKKCGTSVRNVAGAVEIISGLTPFPGNEYSNEQTNYVIPDVYVYKIDGDFVIQLNNDGLPNLQLSPRYQSLLQENGALNSESKGYLREKMRSAEWFIKSIQQRQRTIYKVMESLLKFQRAFFEHGASELRPLVLRDVAEDISMHESTVSRVTSNKYVHTPLGIYELKYFFTTGVATVDGDLVAAESIKNKIKHLIQNEDPTKPLSDNKISQMLEDDNIKVARRTVAKYRDQLKILPVKHRRKTRM